MLLDLAGSIYHIECCICVLFGPGPPEGVQRFTGRMEVACTPSRCNYGCLKTPLAYSCSPVMAPSAEVKECDVLSVNAGDSWWMNSGVELVEVVAYLHF